MKPTPSRFIGKRTLFINLLILAVLKLALSPATFQLGAIIDAIPGFNSRTIIEKTNDVRQSSGLTPLKSNYQLDLAAHQKLENMIDEGYFAHVSPDGVTPWYWMREADYQYSFAGENLAVGFLTPSATVEAWMVSPTHRANILNNRYEEIGVAVGYLKTETTDGILVVQMFGRPKTAIVAGVQPPTQSPAVLPSASATAQKPVTTLAGQQVAPAETRPAPTRLQYAAVREPEEPEMPAVTVVTTTSETSRINQWSAALNSWFVIYSLIVAVLAVLIAMFVRDMRPRFGYAALHTGVAVLAALLPTAQTSLQGIIF